MAASPLHPERGAPAPSRRALILFPLLLLAGAAAAPTPSARTIKAHVVFLASDALEGRGTGARGGDLASLYIATEFSQLGLAPGAEGESFAQSVPLYGVKTDPKTELLVKPTGGSTGDGALLLAFGDDWVGTTARQTDTVIVDGGVVFVGYGVSAPEANWDDWKDVDVRDKVVLMLVNDPPATTAEPALFGGRGLTYYGRWSYKLEEATRRGAAAVILVHSDESAGYPWGVVRTSNGGWRFDHERDPKSPAHALALRSWITQDSARRLLKLAGKALEPLVAAAATRDFRPVELGLTARVRLQGETKRWVRSSNVAGIVRGRDPKLADEYVVVTAHWDHLGIGEPDESGDPIYNGAVDNASGVGGMLAIAEALAKNPPKRSVLFLATTAEEQGLLGAKWWTKQPSVPIDKVVANVNLDPMNVDALVDDIVPLGSDRSSLEKDVAAIAKERKLTVTPDPRPDQGTFYRSDHFPFAQLGIPAISLKTGTRYRGKPIGWAEARFHEFNTERYHQPSDQVNGDFDWDALAQHAEIAQALIVRIANAPKRPTLDADDEFARPRSP